MPCGFGGNLPEPYPPSSRFYGHLPRNATVDGSRSGKIYAHCPRLTFFAPARASSIPPVTKLNVFGVQRSVAVYRRLIGPGHWVALSRRRLPFSGWRTDHSIALVPPSSFSKTLKRNCQCKRFFRPQELKPIFEGRAHPRIADRLSSPRARSARTQRKIRGLVCNREVNTAYQPHIVLINSAVGVPFTIGTTTLT